MKQRLLAAAAALVLSGCGSDEKRFLDAVGRDDVAAVRALLAEDRDLVHARRTDRQGHFTLPLHQAARQNHVEMTRALLEGGADPNARDAGELTALHAAVDGGVATIVEMVLGRGARVDAIDVHGNTALHHAVRSDWSAVLVPLLLKRGVPLTTANRDGNTPLHTAAATGSVVGAAFLCAAGAGPEVGNAARLIPQAVVRQGPVVEFRDALSTWLAPQDGECTRLAASAAAGTPAWEEARRAALEAFGCAHQNRELEGCQALSAIGTDITGR